MTEDEHRQKYPSEAAERFQVRLSPGLRDRIRGAAERNNRSMNSEIVATLEEKYPDTTFDVYALDELLRHISPDLFPKGSQESVGWLNILLDHSGSAWRVRLDEDGQVIFRQDNSSGKVE